VRGGVKVKGEAWVNGGTAGFLIGAPFNLSCNAKLMIHPDVNVGMSVVFAGVPKHGDAHGVMGNIPPKN
jgi:hypothetical protein